VKINRKAERPSNSGANNGYNHLKQEKDFIKPNGETIISYPAKPCYKRKRAVIAKYSKPRTSSI
jgi:hypothetical protein